MSVRENQSRTHQVAWYRSAWLPGAAWTVSIVMLVFWVIPSWANGYAASHQMDQLRRLKLSVAAGEANLVRLQRTAPQRQQRWNELRSRSADGDDESIRSRWLDVLRGHDARIRQLEIRQPVTRDWFGLNETLDNDTLPFGSDESLRYQLHQRTILLKFEAALEPTEKVIEELLGDDPIAEMIRLTIQPTPEPSKVQTTIEIKLYGLTNRQSDRSGQATDEPADTQDPSTESDLPNEPVAGVNHASLETVS